MIWLCIKESCELKARDSVVAVCTTEAGARAAAEEDAGRPLTWKDGRAYLGDDDWFTVEHEVK